MVGVEGDRIGPEAWVGAAYQALARDGEAAVAVEPLARALGVTKGSFYHHFADKDALWTAVLADFEARGTEDLIAATGAIDDPRRRLPSLFTAVWDSPGKLRAHRALLGSRRPDVVACLERVHARRRGFLVRCYRELGLPDDRAEHLAAAAYAVFLGAVLLVDQPPFDRVETLHPWVETITGLLLPPVTG
ncbi:MAG: TetR/AcrR family transcriptional regulator [Myxococcota bacterium]